MAITFDKTLNTIEISIDVSSTTIQELIDAIRDWEDSAEGIVVMSVANAYGKQDIGGGAKVGITLELINNWRVHFAERESWTNCYVFGGNIVAINDYSNDPIKSSDYVNTIIAQSTSPSLVYAEGGGGTWTEEEKNIVLSNIETIKQINSGRWVLVNNQLICYKEDNQTEIMRFDLFDENGEPTMENTYERTRV